MLRIQMRAPARPLCRRLQSFPSSRAAGVTRVVAASYKTSACHYTILGVTESATEEDIKAAYRRLARQYHPDVNKTTDAYEKFLQFKIAYEILSDQQARAAYDRERKAPKYPPKRPFGSTQPGGFSGGFTVWRP